MLAMDPARDAERILALRATLLGGAEQALPPLLDDDDPAAERRHWAGLLEDLRRDFWSLDESSLAARLARIDPGRAPELSPSLARLRTVAGQRGVFDQLAAPPDTAGFVDLFRQVVVAPPREAARLRDGQLDQLLRAPRPRRDPRVRAAQRVARAVADGHADLFALEEEWLEGIMAIGREESRLERAVVRVLRRGVVQLALVALVLLLAGLLLR
jgi:hypothetical protein